jgi:hypothetical protein
VATHVERSSALADDFEQPIAPRSSTHRFRDVAAATAFPGKLIDFGDDFVWEYYV